MFLRSLSTCAMLAGLVLILLGISGCSHQQTDTKLSPTPHWIKDDAGTLTLAGVINKDLATQWTKAAQSNPNFGFTNSVIWLSLPFENLSDTPGKRILEIAFPLHDNLDVYLIDGDRIVKTFNSGDLERFADRPVNHRHFLFPHVVPPNTKLRAIIRAKSTETMYLPVKVWQSSSAFIVQDQHQTLLLGLFFGALLIMLVYNLFLYFSTGHKNYLNYVWVTAAIVYLQLTQKSVGYQYLWPEQGFFNHISFPLSSFLAIATSTFFMLNFLNLDRRVNPKTILAFNAMTWISLLGMAFTAITFIADPVSVAYKPIILSVALMGAASTIIVMLLLGNLALRGNRSALILSIAWLSLLIGSLLFALGRIGLPIPMLFAENAMLIGSTFEAALISFALAMHIKTERDKRLKAQELALASERKTLEAQNSLLRLQEEVTQQLEEEVQERTQKLQSAMQRLEAANHKLDNLSRLDPLTGLSNRRDFDQAFGEQWIKSAELNQPVSILMADIDYFKSINDNYGHLFGDQCLVEVAAVLKGCLQKTDCVAARFGGEEFIILLPDTFAAEAGRIAEKVRKQIEKLRLKHQEGEIGFTISVGVASDIPKPKSTNTNLVADADEALYLAKEGGRNRVVGPASGKLFAASKPKAATLKTSIA